MLSGLPYDFQGTLYIMQIRIKNWTLSLMATLALATLSSCGSSDDGTGSASAGATVVPGTSTEDIVFSGIGSANANSPREVVISWSEAVLRPDLNGSEGMRYRIYRGNTAAETLSDGALIATTDAGVTSYVDTGLPDNTTLYYRVVAIDSDERYSRSQEITSARTPSEFGPGTVNFNSDVLPLFQAVVPGGTTTCLDCHSGGNPSGGLDLSTHSGLLAGIGTLSNPDSFIIPFLGDETWSEFQSRFTGAFIPHLEYIAQPTDLLAMELPLKAWTLEGALQNPDPTPPVFEFANPGNAGLYSGQFIDYDTVRLEIPHASDPESIPVTGSIAGQLDYVVYAGADSSSINWDRPVAIKTLDLSEANLPFVTIEFDYTESNNVVVVVRPMDAAGRSVDIDILNYDPTTADANEKELYRKRMRNMSSNEREITITR